MTLNERIKNLQQVSGDIEKGLLPDAHLSPAANFVVGATREIEKFIEAAPYSIKVHELLELVFESNMSLETFVHLDVATQGKLVEEFLARKKLDSADMVN